MVFPVIGGDGKPTGYDISNSLRFNDGDSPSLQFTPSSAGNEKTWTVSFWVKRGVMGTSSSQMIFASDTNYDEYVFCRFCGTEVTGKTDMFQVFMVEPNAREGNVRTTRLFRDPSAWYHIVVRCDLTQGTAADRLRIYVNGVKETSFDTASYLNQNDDNVNWNSNVPQAIGHQKQASSVERHLDGYISEFYNIDGSSLGPDSFGETNDNGVWIPKDAKNDLTFGTNGYYLQFKQTGTSANSSGIGADTSGNDHHWTPANLAARNVVQDTPTNNFMTWNPLYTNSRGVFAEGNCQVTTNVQGSVPYGQVEFGNFHVNSGKWYWEVEVVDVGSGGSLGLGANERAYEGTYVNGHNNGGSSGNIRYNHSNGNVNNGSSTAVSGAATYTDDDTIGFAMDLDNNKMYIHKNGTYINSGDPAAGSNGITMTSSYSDYWTPWISKDDTNHNAKVYLNTGNPVIANDSGNADDNGYGDFEYDVPAGFYALCTKNLATYG